MRLSRINKGLEVLEFHGVASFENRCLTKVLSGMSALRTLRIPEAQLIYEGLLGVVAKLTSLQDLDFSYVSCLLARSPAKRCEWLPVHVSRPSV